METKYKATLSFTYVDEINPENEQPGTCNITLEQFQRFFQLAFKGSQLISVEKQGTSFDCIFSTIVEYHNIMMSMMTFRFKMSGKMAKVADIGIIVVS